MSSAPDCAAQDSLALLSNVRVRVVMPDSLRSAPLTRPRRVLVGTLLRATTDTLYLQVGTPDTVRIARLGVRQVAVSRGVSPARSAILFATLVGLQSSLLGNLLDMQSRRNGHSRALVYGGVGFGVGAAFGAISPFEQWRRVRR